MSAILYTNNRLKSASDHASLAVEVFLFVKLETMNSIATRLLPLVLCLSISWSAFAAYPPAQKKATTRLPRPRQLDQGVTWQRDPATGELVPVPKGADDSTGGGPAIPNGPGPIRSVSQMVAVTCTVSTSGGVAVPGLQRDDFRVFDNGIEQSISYFDASTQPGSIALVIDASPSVLRDADEMQKAADALIDALAPLDQAAVLDFSAHTYLQLPFSDVRELVRRAVARVDVRALLGDTGGSNIYEAVYLTARDLFAGRSGRKAIVLLTDGQDSGLGLTLDPASASPHPGNVDNRLTFDDVSRILASQDIQLFAVSTETRPKVMTPDWISAHANSTLLTSSARTSGIPPYTLYLAELVRRAGGQLYFLRETRTMADTFRQIASKIRAEYTIGFSPRPGQDASQDTIQSDAAQPGWHSLRIEIAGEGDAVVAHRADYYVPESP
jgi:Ca-activated chloride channel homolog